MHQDHPGDMVQDGAGREEPLQVNHVVGQDAPLEVAPDNVADLAPAIGPGRQGMHLEKTGQELLVHIGRESFSCQQKNSSSRGRFFLLLKEEVLLEKSAYSQGTRNVLSATQRWGRGGSRRGKRYTLGVHDKI